jgi:hypothetical protein
MKKQRMILEIQLLDNDEINLSFEFEPAIKLEEIDQCEDMDKMKLQAAVVLLARIIKQKVQIGLEI